MIGHDDPRHGTDRGYAAGCRETCCRQAHTAAVAAYRADPGRLVDPAPTRRRLDALACHGWSLSSLSLRLGRDRHYLQLLSRRSKLQRSTAEKVTALYDELHDVDCAEPYAQRTIREALARGAVPPRAWTDIQTGVLAVAHLPEKICCCPLEVPNRRTPYGIQCYGCGWGYAFEDAAA